MTRGIPLTNGGVALVDDEDFERIAAHRWRGQRIGRTVYAARGEYLGKYKTRTIYMHREILTAPVGVLVDHEDGDGLNNRRANIRFATKTQNAWNQPPADPSRFKGVSWHKAWRRWIAYYTSGRRQIVIGGFHDPVEAARAYDAEIVKVRGQFAFTNARAGLLSDAE